LSIVRPLSRQVEPLLDLEPDLGGDLSGEDFACARAAIKVPVEVLERGPWQSPQEGDPAALGLLVVSGFLVRELRLGAAARFAELLGPGDLLRPWQDENEGGLLSWTSSWRVLDEAAIATLGAEVGKLAAQWPELGNGLTRRAMQRARRQSVAATIPTLVRVQDRLVVLFMHLADRWGHVTREGIVLRLPLTHELIARLSGGRRPTVTTALGALRTRGVIGQPDDGVWLLKPPIYEELEAICRGDIRYLTERSPIGA
jgi:CRP/FNR family cyclic AMP-dependent transcriptional regulator